MENGRNLRVYKGKTDSTMHRNVARNFGSIVNGGWNRKCAEFWMFIRSTAFGRRKRPKKGMCVAVTAKKFLISKGPPFVFFEFSIPTAVYN